MNEWQKFWNTEENALRRVIGMDLIGDIGIITFFHKIFEITHEGYEPNLFETIGSDRNTNETLYSASYKTWEHALKGHQKAIDWAFTECNDYYQTPSCR
jgi:hypothetical protein